jgi:hypothetical protein
MDWKKAVMAGGGLLFAVAGAIVHLQAGPHWLQTASLVAMTALGALGLGFTQPIFAPAPKVAPVIELKPVPKE